MLCGVGRLGRIREVLAAGRGKDRRRRALKLLLINGFGVRVRGGAPLLTLADEPGSDQRPLVLTIGTDAYDGLRSTRVMMSTTWSVRVSMKPGVQARYPIPASMVASCSSGKKQSATRLISN